MDFSLGNSYMMGTVSVDTAKQAAQAEELKKKLNSGNSSEDEMMEACKSFEKYLVEQILQEMKKTVPKDEEEENDYMEYFGDMLYQQYAESITESGQLGIAQQLYEAMKYNSL